MQNDITLYQLRCRAAARARKARSERNAREEFIKQRFWSKVEKRGPNECWPWIAGLAGRGYGAFRIKGRKVASHRFAWECFNGTIPEGLLACHHCDNPVCCNPNHIFIGTNSDNHKDCVAKGRNNSAKGEQHGSSKITEWQAKKIRIGYSNGETSKALAEIFGISVGQVVQIISGRSWKHIADSVPCVPRPPCGETHGGHKITEQQSKHIREAYIPRIKTMQSLADEFGIGLGTVFDIIHGRTWSNSKRLAA